MKQVTLWESGHYDKRPKWWINFVEYANSEEIVETWYDLNDILKDYNARFWFDRSAEDPSRYLDFESEADHVLFVLKFS